MAQTTDLLKRTGGKTFCQILGRDITAPSCLEMQGHEGCFGCAAPTRLCELCSKRTVDVPAVGMCSRCLIGQLQQEVAPRKPKTGELTRVSCQLLKRQISGQMCLATQGQEGCRNCPAPTRICENCERHPIRFKEYGLCLACSVEEYGNGWDRSATEKVAAEVAVHVPESEATQSPKPTRKLEDMVVVALLNRRVHPAEEFDSQVGEQPVVKDATPEVPATPVERNGNGPTLVRTSATRVGDRDYKVTVRVNPFGGGGGSMSPGQPAETVNPAVEFERLVRKAKKVVIEKRRASVGLVRSELGVTWSIAREIIEQLEKDGVVGPDRPKTSRQVLILPQEERIKPTPEKPGRMDETEALAERAKQLIIKHRDASYDFLQRELGTGTNTTYQIMQILERQGVVSSGKRGQLRRILVGSFATLPHRKKPGTRRPKTPPEAKFAILEELARFFGPRSDTSRKLREISADLEELYRIKDSLRRLGQE